MSRASTLVARALTTRPKRRSVRLPMNVSGGLYKFEEKCNLGALSTLPAINVASNTGSGGILTFKLRDLANAPSYIGLFDLYKIDKVELTIHPMANVAQTYLVGAPASASALPMLYIAPNKDYYTPSPAGSGDVLNDDGAVAVTLDKPKTFTIWQPKPRIKDAGGADYQVGILPDSSPLWLTTGGNAQVLDQSNVDYYGFRWWVDNTQNSAPVIPHIIATYYVSFKERD